MDTIAGIDHSSAVADTIGPRRNLADRLRSIRRLTSRIEAAQVRHFGWSGLSVVFRTPVLLLESTGRRTGRARRTPVAYVRVGDDDLIVVGGAGGQKRVPDWVANVRADPSVVVTLKRRSISMTAVELVGRDHAETWPGLVRAWPRVGRYEQRAGRPIPVFRLTRS